MIVITGASDGLGLELTKLYKAAGKTLVNVLLDLSKSIEASRIILNRKTAG